METVQQFLTPQTIGNFLTATLLIGGGPAAIAYAIFRFLGNKWIESKFAAQLEAERHEHAKELQELKKKLDAQLSRINKLQDREFEVLRDAWDFLQDAANHVSALLSIMRSYPDLSKLSPQRFDEFLANSRLSEVHRQEVRAAIDRNKHYQDLIFWYDINDAKQAYWKYRSLVTKNSIFLRSELCDLFEKIAGTMYEGLIAREVGEEAKDMKMWVEASKKMREQLTPLIEELREAVRLRLSEPGKQ